MKQYYDPDTGLYYDPNAQEWYDPYADEQVGKEDPDQEREAPPPRMKPKSLGTTIAHTRGVKDKQKSNLGSAARSMR